MYAQKILESVDRYGTGASVEHISKTETIHQQRSTTAWITVRELLQYEMGFCIHLSSVVD